MKVQTSNSGVRGLLAVAVLSLAVTAGAEPGTAGVSGKADRIVIDKSERQLRLEQHGRTIARYAIALGGNPTGHKRFEGDERTPEGLYEIDYKNQHSAFHLSLRISYPNEHDRAYARDHQRSAGGDIMIHGLRDGFGWIGDAHRKSDWTDGCIAVTNTEIEEIWSYVEVGTPIVINP